MIIVPVTGDKLRNGKEKVFMLVLKSKKSKPDYKWETYYATAGFIRIAGLDEVGMSSIAGPCVASAVILSPDMTIKGLDDSKRLSPEQREYLYDIILKNCVDYGVGIASVQTIEQKNIYWASRDAMISAIEQLASPPDFLLIDGGQPLKYNITQTSIIKGDTKCASIAAASIVAKVTRDRLMCRLHELYPNYGWCQNKGYPTDFHREAITKYGITEHHRKGFAGVIKKGKWKTHQGLGE